jgi:hypothetical protein
LLYPSTPISAADIHAIGMAFTAGWTGHRISLGRKMPDLAQRKSHAQWEIALPTRTWNDEVAIRELCNMNFVFHAAL